MVTCWSIIAGLVGGRQMASFALPADGLIKRLRVIRRAAGSSGQWIRSRSATCKRAGPTTGQARDDSDKSALPRSSGGGGGETLKSVLAFHLSPVESAESMEQARRGCSDYNL